MKLRSLVVAAALAAGLVAAAPGSASANILWCAGDPPVQVVTPGGTSLVVNNYLYVSSADERALARDATADGYAIPDGSLGTLVVITVHVPRGLTHLIAVSAQQRYKLATSAEGQGDSEITLTLDVPQS